MADRFDPYRVWLGIGPRDRPPHYYQLLKLPLFEDDLNAIGLAAERQLQRVERFLDTPHDATARRLTLEIETARDCLLCPASRQRYDAELQRRGVVADAARPPATAADDAVPPAVHQSARPRTPVPWWRSQWFQIPAGGIAGLLIALPLANAIRQWRTPPAANSVVAAAPAPATLPAVQPPATTDSVARPPTDEAATDELAAQPATVEPAAAAPEIELLVQEVAVEEDEAEPMAESAAADQDVAGDEAANPPDAAPPAAESPAAEAATPPGKLPVPDQGQLREAEQQIRKLLHAELDAVKTRDQALAVVNKLLELAQQSQTDAALRYALLQLARQRAEAAGSLPLAVEAIARIEAVYEFDPWAERVASLSATLDAVRQLRDPGVSGEAALAAAGKLVDAAVAADAYSPAREMMAVLTTAAQRAKLAPLARELTGRERELRRLQDGFTAYEAARTALAADAADGEANLAAGRWLALVKGRWDEALPLLARGRDAALAELAANDLAAPGDAEAQSALAAAWWQQATAETGGHRAMTARRAVFWYDQALASLAGLAKIEAEQGRLEALATVGDPEAAKVPGEIAEGDVALATKGATLVGVGVTNPQHLLDGTLAAYASAKCPCEWIIPLGKQYRLQEIRLHLHAPKSYSYHYAVATSPDGRRFVPLAERLSDRNATFEQLRFEARPVAAIKILGIASTASKLLYATELEAYCIPPEVVGKK